VSERESARENSFSHRVNVCVCERERERERENVCVREISGPYRTPPKGQIGDIGHEVQARFFYSFLRPPFARDR